MSQDTNAMTKMKTVSDGRKTVASTMARNSTGIERKASTTRIMKESTQLPKNPDIAP